MVLGKRDGGSSQRKVKTGSREHTADEAEGRASKGRVKLAGTVWRTCNVHGKDTVIFHGLVEKVVELWICDSKGRVLNLPVHDYFSNALFADI
jgi:hypothetical protein